MRTRSKSAMLRARAAAKETRSWSRIASTTCPPTAETGERLVIGSWKIMPSSEPRSARISGTESSVSSRAPSRIEPRSMRPGFGTRRIAASAVIDFPQPDSPTRASTSPRAIAKEMPSTTGRRAPPTGKVMRRSLMASAGSCACGSGALALTHAPAACADRARRAAHRR